MGSYHNCILKVSRLGEEARDGSSLCGHLLVLSPRQSAFISPDALPFPLWRNGVVLSESAGLQAGRSFFQQLCPWSIVMAAWLL